MRKPGKGKAQAGRKPKATAEQAAKIKAFREGRGWSHAKLAEMLGLTTPNAIYAWENRIYGVSKDTFVKLANLTDQGEWDYTKEFLSWAGVEFKTMEKIADKIVGAERLSSAERNVLVHSLETSEDALPFNTWMLGSPASARFLRVTVHGKGRELIKRIGYATTNAEKDAADWKPFRDGDVILLEPLATDLRDVEEDEFLALFIAPDPSSKYSQYWHPHIGHLSKQSVSSNEVYYLLKMRTSKDIVIGTSRGGGPVEFISGQTVLRVAGWIGHKEAEGK